MHFKLLSDFISIMSYFKLKIYKLIYNEELYINKYLVS
jgi:hypothetical protein